MPQAQPMPHERRPTCPLFSVVVPVYNEEACIREMASRLTHALSGLEGSSEIIFVDDGSTDGTLAVVKELGKRDRSIKYISFSRNFGHQMALAAGIEHARGDAVISLDGDLQHPPELIPRMVESWLHGNDVVFTVRKGNSGHAFKETVSRAFYRLLRRLTGVDVATGGADFRLIDRKVAGALRNCDEHFVFVRGLVPWLGFRRDSIPYQAGERYGGKTKYLAGRMLRFALDGIFSFSIVPLRAISLLGATTIALGLVYGAYSVFVRFFSDTAVSGWTSLVIVILVFSGTQLLSLGILSEYVGRIYEEVKRRPRYVVNTMSSDLEVGG